MPGKVALIYVVVAGLWILISDALLDWWFVTPEWRRWATSLKGLFFVGASAVLLYFLLRRWALRVEQGHRQRLRAESAFRTLVDAAPDAIFVELEGRYVFANPALVRLLGVGGAEELLGQVVMEHIAPVFREEVRVRMEQMRRERKPLEPVEGWVRRVDGQDVPVEVTAVPIDFNSKLAVLVFARNLSVRVATEAARREQQELLQAVLRSTSDAIFVKDLAGRYLLVNASGSRLLGHPTEGVLGCRNQDLLPEDVAATLELADRQVLQTGRRCEFDVPLLVGKQCRHFFVTIEPMLDPAGRLTGLVGVARDRTEQVEAEDSLRRMSGMFLRLQDEERRHIARELHDTTAQALVAVSLGLSEAMRVAADTNPELERALEECRVLVDGCTRDVRTLSYGLHPPMLDEMGLHAALEEYVKELAKRSGLRLECAFGQELGRLNQDAETALFRVAQEALMNVHRHSGSPMAQVTLRAANGDIELEIRDAGKGIPEGRLVQIRRGTTMGVGISGMRERLRQLRGELEVTSDASGTTVLARLPLGRAMLILDKGR